MNLNPGDEDHGYRLVSWTQHWRLIGNRWYRDAVAVRLFDGETRLVSWPDEA